MNKKKVNLLIQNLENLLECLKLELEDDEEEKNIVKITDLIPQVALDEDVEYYEEGDDGPDILLNNKEEQKFYGRFNLGE
jgi:hypothetical protein